ncbi:hypothetical protein IFM89_009771 [Coptis chinensis]|uniref:Coenzyme Q-binding protein COQ10 START domain-containing protein n=1 Tax=Coptis chinensis TaxID=261450 RepID=A0A835HWT4_9MAGN|nr:hypothetical protein IFM89_009771 [Coptis chinensis]
MIISYSSSNFHFTSSLKLNSNANRRNLGFLFYIQSNSFLGIKCSSALSSFSSPHKRNSRSCIRSYIRNESKEEEERKVLCEVDVISWRERRIKATTLVYSDIESVWNALTDYERLAEFIPNLTSSGQIPCPHPGRIWLEQRGLQRALYWHIEAHVVLDLQEFPDSVNGHELHFSMVDGDFKKFEGKWLLKSGKRSSTTTLSYEVNVIPRFNFPAIFLERIIRSDLPVNLKALARRAERNSGLNQKTLFLGRISAPTPEPAVVYPYLHSTGSLLEKDQLFSGEFKENQTSSSFSPSPPFSSSEFNRRWGVFGKVCGLDKPCMVDEVHFRRFDGLLENGGVHRCVIASITVKAPVREVWNVLTAYETLPEIVPNLAISKILSRENNKVRILQEGCKGLLYMVLHARVVLDLSEKLEQEINFEQVIYEDLPSNLCAIRDYIEKQDAADSIETFDTITHSEEKVSPSVDRTHAKDSESAHEVPDFKRPNPLRQRPRVPGLQRDIEVLKAELLTFISKYGQEGFMPMRKQLRLHGRIDIEKAITRMGGFRKIASVMNLSLAYKHRKPKGYWDNLDNMQEEIIRFQRSWGMDLTYMPSRKSFERAGRYDIARALEKWGGLHEVSRLLSLKVRHPNRQANPAREKRSETIEPNDLESDENMTYNNKPYISQDTQKWLTELKHLDINWME